MPSLSSLFRNIRGRRGSFWNDRGPSPEAIDALIQARETGPLPVSTEDYSSFNASVQDAQGSSSHRCLHCNLVQISVNDDIKSHYSQSRRKWQYTVAHTMAEVSEAASDGCPFFAWLWRQISRSQTPSHQLLKTQIQLEFETGETVSHLVAENSHAVSVMVSTKHYSWPAARFDVVSHFSKHFQVSL